MKNLNLPSNLKDKIYQIKVNPQNDFSKIVSYFPLSADEKQLIVTLMNNSKSFDGFLLFFLIISLSKNGINPKRR